MNEPKTTITTVDYTIGYSPDPPDTRLNILSPVIAPQGPVDLVRVNGPSEFQRLFFGGRSVKSSDDFSAIYARGLVANAPIWIKRGVRDNIKGGLSSGLAREVYTDSSLNIIDGIKSYFAFDKESDGFVSYEEALADTINPVRSEKLEFSDTPSEPQPGQFVFESVSGVSEYDFKITGYDAPFVDGAGVHISTENFSKYGIRLSFSGDMGKSEQVVNYTEEIPEGETVKQYCVYFNNTEVGSIETIDGFYVDVTPDHSSSQIVVNGDMVYAPNVADIPLSLRETTPILTEFRCGLGMVVGETAVEDVTISIGNKAFKFTSSSEGFSVEDLTKLKAAGVFPQVFFDANGSTIAVRADDDNNIEKIGDRPIIAMFWNSGVGISYTNLRDAFVVYRDHAVDTTLTPNEIDINSESYPYSISDCYQGIIRNNDQYLENYVIEDIKYDLTTYEGVTYCFYTGDVTPNADINVKLGDELTFEGFYKELIKQGSDLLHADSGESFSIIFPEVNSATLTDKQSVLVLDNKVLNTITYNDKFAILSAFPCETNEISVTIAEGSVDESYNLTVTYGSDTEVWEISFDSGVTDGYGNSLYYTNVNDQSSYIRIVELSGPNVIYQTLTLGNEVSSKYCGSKEIQSALEFMKESDESSVDFDYITDGGYADPSLGRFILNQLCEYYNSFFAPSVKTGVPLIEQDLIVYRDNFGDLARGRFIANTQRANVLDNGQTEMPASYFYLVARINLGNTVREFVKFMEETNGDIGMQNPIQKFTRTKRENLLDHQIVTLKRGRNGSWFLNECTTLYKRSSYLQEDGTVLMVNKINQLARAYGDPLKGQDNTADLRSSVETELLRIINDRVRTGTPYGPINIKVVCNDTNNPVSLQNQRKLRIDIYATFSRSIKDVLIYTNIIPLS